MTHDLQHCLLVHLEQLARPRHAQWDRLGLMSVRTYIHEQLTALLELVRRSSASPSHRPVWIVAFDQEEWGMLGSRAVAAGKVPAADPQRVHELVAHSRGWVERSQLEQVMPA